MRHASVWGLATEYIMLSKICTLHRLLRPLSDFCVIKLVILTVLHNYLTVMFLFTQKLVHGELLFAGVGY